MGNLMWLQNWYTKHSEYSPIEMDFHTIASTHWDIYINFKGSKYQDTPDFSCVVEKPEYDKYSINLAKGIFRAGGSLSRLDFLIGKFRELIGESEISKKKSDHFWDGKIQQFLFEQEKDLIIFLHYTFKKTSADNILKTGFKFYDFDKTALKANNYPTELNYNHNIRRQFGEYVVVICFSRDLYLRYLAEIDKTSKIHIKVEEVLAEKPPFINDDQEMVYTLHHKYIKGYFNYATCEIVPNPDYDPYFDSEEFMKNIVG
jgi:hypothetical protein